MLQFVNVRFFRHARPPAFGPRSERERESFGARLGRGRQADVDETAFVAEFADTKTLRRMDAIMRIGVL
jgi:hypothetical protein